MSKSENIKIIEEFLAQYGKENIEEFIEKHYDNDNENIEVTIDEVSDLYKLNGQEIDFFIDDYKDYKNETTLSDDERDGWDDLTDYNNKD